MRRKMAKHPICSSVFILGFLLLTLITTPTQTDTSTGQFRIGEEFPGPKPFDSDEWMIETLNEWGYWLFNFGMMGLFVMGIGVIVLRILYDK